MNANKLGSRRSLTPDIARADAHKVTADEYDEHPELTDDMLARDAEQRWTAFVGESAQADFTAFAG